MAAQAAAAPRETVGTAPTEFYFASGADDYIGGGATVDYTDPTVTVSSSLITANVGGWTLNLAAPAGEQLTAGTTYSGATRYPFNTGTAPGISVYGNGRGCNNDYGTFTIIEISATSVNATFSQTCESTTAPPLVGFIRFNATTVTPVPTLPSTVLPITPPANSGTTSANADEFSFLSAAGDYIGGGQPADYTGSSVQASGTLGAVAVNAGPWSLDLSAPAGEQLVPGTYVGATRYPFNTGTASGITVSGDGRGCNNDYGTFTIYQIATDSTGALTLLNATFSQTCESTTAPPLVGFIRFNATTPTPVPTLPSALVAHLKATTGAAQADGQTDVTLDASGTTGAEGAASYSFNFGDGSTPTVSATPTVTKPEWEGTYEVVVTVTDSAGRVASSTPQWLTVGDAYHAVAPTRILDTRKGQGAAGPVADNGKITLTLPSSITDSGHGPLTAVVLNVTATDSTGPGYITAYSTGLSQAPTTSNLNYNKSETVANLVTVPVLPGGKVVLAVTQLGGTVQLVGDLEGYYAAGDDPTGAGYGAVTPTRIMDTRNGTGDVGGRIAANKTVKLKLPSSVPAGATAVALNVTAVSPSAGGYVAVYPDGTSMTTSNLNYSPSATTAAMVIVQVPADRVIDFTVVSGATDLLADLNGYFSTSATAKFVLYYPTRLFDTRTNFLPGPLPSDSGISVELAYGLQVPVPALTAALYNVTATDTENFGVVSVVPDPIGDTLPSVSSLNFAKGQTVANSVLAPMTDGSQDFFNGGPAPIQLLADFFGYFAQPVTTTAPPASASSSSRAGSTSSPAANSPARSAKKLVNDLH